MRKRFPMNLQLFAEGGNTGSGTGGQSGQGVSTGSQGAGSGSQGGAAGQGQPGAGDGTGIQFDYEKLAGLIAGKTSVTEDTVLKSYFKQQGLSQEEMAQAIQAFKAQKAANQPDVGALQSQAAQAQKAAQEAQLEKAAVLAAVGLGIDAKTIPYLIKMTDLSQTVGQDGKINEETVTNALKKTLEDVPGLKPAQSSQGGFIQMGVSGSGNQQQADDAALKAAFGLKKKKEREKDMALPKPLRKIEVYLYALATGEKGGLPKARTRAESYLKYLAENPPQGPAGPKGDAGKGVKSITLTTNETGAVTGGTVTYTDDSTSSITVTSSQG